MVNEWTNCEVRLAADDKRKTFLSSRESEREEDEEISKVAQTVPSGDAVACGCSNRRFI